MVCLGRVVSPSMYFLFFSIFLATFRGRKSLTKYWTLLLLENFFPLVVAKKSMRNNQQTQNYQTIKPSSSTEIIPNYNRTLSSYDLFALQWGRGETTWILIIFQCHPTVFVYSLTKISYLIVLWGRIIKQSFIMQFVLCLQKYYSYKPPPATQ